MLKGLLALFITTLLLSFSNAPSPIPIDKVEAQVFEKINSYRKRKGLSALKRNQKLDELARKHCAYMMKKKRISHDGFDDRYGKIITQLSANGAAENVASNFGYNDPASAAVEGWIKSKGHRKNIKGEFNLTGIGVLWDPVKEGYYFTQLFASVP